MDMKAHRPWKAVRQVRKPFSLPFGERTIT